MKQGSKELLITKINDALTQLELRIDAVRRQGIINAEMFFSFQEGLIILRDKILSEQKVETKFIKNWDVHIGLSSRFFEGDPILDILYEIDDLLKQ